jgi:hypothetical protein
VHVHLHTDSLTDLTTDTDTDRGAEPPVGVARVDTVGPVSLHAVTRWLQGLAPGSSIKLTPVIDLNEHLSVDAYEVPDRLRAQVEHRDPGCVFPWCGRRGRYDTDHITEFDHGDSDTGRPPPPAQTTTANLARLCRFHHRVKTHSEWTYRRQGPTTVEWTSPHGRRYRVDHTGTINLN